MIPIEAGFGRDTACIMLSTANGHSVSCRRRDAATRSVFWSRGSNIILEDGICLTTFGKVQVGGLVWYLF